MRTATSSADPDPEGDATADDGERPRSLAEAVSLRSNALVGLAAGVALATAVYVPRIPNLQLSVSGSGGLYLGLALVLAVTTAAVVTAALCAKVFLEPILDRRAWLRRGGTAAALGGLGWMALPVLAWLVDVGAVSEGRWAIWASFATLSVFVGAIGLHAALRDGAGWGERVAYWVVALALLLAADHALGNPGPFASTDGTPLFTPYFTTTMAAVVGSGVLALAGRSSDTVARRRLSVLATGAAVAVVGVALLVLGGWGLLEDAVSSPEAIAVGVGTVPAGLGWVVAGTALRTYSESDELCEKVGETGDDTDR